MKKYQFCIRFSDIDINSAASKAVMDCNQIFAGHGYIDYTFTVNNNYRKSRYYLHLIKELIVFFLQIERNSLIGIQYPLLSINNVFKYFVRAAKLKGAKFFCIIHDLESLRSGAHDEVQIAKEVANLNVYDTVIAHNEAMAAWLSSQGVQRKIIPLGLFDYLTDTAKSISPLPPGKTIVFAGNLAKSTFIYDLPKIAGWNFNMYGPGYDIALYGQQERLHWAGEFSPALIATVLRGDFGLIWDGKDMEKCDEVLGNYLKYNNPHKCSLYIAAGLPVIAPRDSAIGKLILELNIGLLVDNLQELGTLEFSSKEYEIMKSNVRALSESVRNGAFFSRAIDLIEHSI